MNQFRRFMYGRYGVDQFTIFIVIMSMLITFIYSFTRFLPIYPFAYILLIYALYRTFSKNIQNRSRENQIFTQIFGSMKKKLINIKLILVGTNTHKYFRCSRCKQIIRVPRNKGKISISCPKCRNEFVKKTWDDFSGKSQTKTVILNMNIYAFIFIKQPISDFWHSNHTIA
jgi:ribosomal protein L37AE/L43A